MQTLQDTTRLRDQYSLVRNGTVSLCESLTPEDMCLQADEDASPTKWHLAHTTWFFENFVLRRHDERYRPYAPEYDFLFNSYYNSVGEYAAKPTRGLISRPTVADVLLYREHTDAAIADRLVAGDLSPELLDTLVIGLHHEQQHQELLLMDIKHLFARNPLRPAFVPEGAGSGDFTASAAPAGWIRFEGGIQRIGAAEGMFSYDNERPRHEALIREFDVAAAPVTCGDYLRFIEEGGYQRSEFWLSDGWTFARQNDWQAPMYWEWIDGRWHVMTLHGRRPLREAEPVCHVSYYEADAFARFMACRLPTEQEWEVASLGSAVHGNFMDQGRFHPAPFGSFEIPTIPAVDSTTSVPRNGQSGVSPVNTNGRAAVDAGAKPVSQPVQLFGDVWEWTSSPYQAYPGYQSYKGGLREYNEKFMCNQFVLRGGSCMTVASHIRRTYRNFYVPSARWVATGIRLARDGGAT